MVDGPVGSHARGMKFHDAALIHTGRHLDSEHQARGHRVVNTGYYASLNCPGLTGLIRGGGQLVILSGVGEVCLQAGELESEHHSDIGRDAGIVRQEVEVGTDLSVELVAGTSHYVLRIGDRHVGHRKVALDEVLLGCSADVHAEHHVDIEAFVDEEGVTDTYGVDYTVAIHTAQVEVDQRVRPETDALLVSHPVVTVRHQVTESAVLRVQGEAGGAEQQGELHVAELRLLDGV